MPALPNRLKERPFKSQKELKHPRTHATLQRYAKRRAAYNAVTVVVLCTFIAHYLPEIRTWREEQRRFKARPANKERQRRHRTKLKLLKRKARLQEKLDAVAAKLAAEEERTRLKEIHLRRHATAQAGFSAGWLAAPTDQAPTKEDKWSTRYREAYAHGAAEKRRCEELMNARQAQSTPAPVAIKLS